MQFWFVTAVAKYLNTATFSEDPLATLNNDFLLQSGGDSLFSLRLLLDNLPY
jgi:hypothetical protein